MGVKVHVQQGLLGKYRIAHHALVDHSAKQRTIALYFRHLPCDVGMEAFRVCIHVLGLSSRQHWVLGADVALGAGGRLEGHGAAGALVEDLAVSSLNVGFDGVQPSEYNLAARAPGGGPKNTA